MDAPVNDIRLVSLEEARSVIARAMVDERESVPARLGGVTLHQHQRAAAARLASLISIHGGAMLAEPVGLGKTYTSLAVAARLGEDLLIATPASLIRMWNDALVACELKAALITHEALSRGATPAFEPRVVIVDEAHRLRSPSARRYAVLANICRVAKVLLVTATPVQNRRSDLAAQLALFLGRGAYELRDEELAIYIVRDSAREDRGQPRLRGPHRVSLPSDDDCLDALLALPAPIPAKDESLAVALQTYGLVHQWSSSRAALLASLARRRARGIALIAALEAGRRPTRAELTAWTHVDGGVQLAFPELVTADAPIDDVSPDLLDEALRLHDSAIVALLERLRGAHNPDVDRANALSQIRARHPGERIIAFCQYVETVHALRALLAREPGIAALTAHGGRTAGGRVSREEVIAQFTPSQSGARSVSPAQRIDLLITTDLLSEGLNLQEASVIVHLDLPWNPARLDQRVGRALRLGSRHEAVTVYSIAPPASAERMLRIEARLRDKLSVAQHTVGIAGRILPSPLAVEPERHGLAEHIGAVNVELGEWLRHHDPREISHCTVVAAATAEMRGFLAAVRLSDDVRLVADVGAGIETGPAAIQRAVVACNGREMAVDASRLESTLMRLRAWIATQVAVATIDFRAAGAARSRRLALARVARALARAPRHQRSRLAPLATAARAVAIAPMAEGAERILDLLVESELPDEAWLRSLATFGELNARPQAEDGTQPRDSESIVGLVLFEPA
jgi:superfamily II DNA or RNA helicase